MGVFYSLSLHSEGLSQTLVVFYIINKPPFNTALEKILGTQRMVAENIHLLYVTGPWYCYIHLEVNCFVQRARQPIWLFINSVRTDEHGTFP